ncbi:hypothetical protein IDM40_03115 [Nocardiopsis sp. HNM0947]|uniref:Uncharacterized protein n=1 Tax=Nocardiopsis coralli TaxID=2772213 RepID=A0ABR9P1H3_9ACTN|nr:hypothetical protein [Nocardiopsis coralli]MBE2997701.1 hypothetical protein [Nocardiopsis coralli]
MALSLSHVLLSALFTDLPHQNHILTLHTGMARSTAIDRRADGFEVEHPEVVERLCTALARGDLASVVLRSFTDQVSHTRPDGVEIPMKLVRGWVASDRTLYPLDEAAMFDAHCMDAASGEPLSPEEGVIYTGAPEVDLAVFHEN